jgi:hypothetical protein
MEPDYADAHFNLAGVLGKAGQGEGGGHPLAAVSRARSG